ncbi:MAG: translesion DNA synthesis-associated protein ImuA [Betaproteobacteria bacterium]|nr:translesion DNA synthesis-associated protein ImuA [Betaproteobacteria bacterium]
MSAALETLLLKSHVWRGDGRAEVAIPSIPTGHAELDELLPGKGWPRGALTELSIPRPGIGEMSLLLPALADLSSREQWIALVAPPHLPYAPALARGRFELSRLIVVRAEDGPDTLWAMEQALASGACAAVIGWPTFLNERALRRLQLAAEKGQAFGAYFSVGHATSSSLASLRLQLFPDGGRLGVRVLKVRGRGIGTTLTLEMGGTSSMRTGFPAPSPVPGPAATASAA